MFEKNALNSTLLMNQKTESSIDNRTIYSSLAGDFVAAAASATAVTPAVAIIDR